MRKHDAGLPPPLGRRFPPTHHPGLLGQGPSLTSWSGFGRRRKEGPRSPPQSPCAALPDWLCVPGAQLQSLWTPSEPQGSRSAATQGGKGAATNPGGPWGEGRGRAGPRSLCEAQLAATSGLRSSPPPALSFPPSGGLPPPPPPPPRPPPPPGFSFLPPARSAAHSAAAARRGERREQMPRGPLAAAADL